MRYAIVDTAFGAFGLVTDAGRLLSTWLPRRESVLRRSMARSYPDATRDDRTMPGLHREIAAYFEGEPTDFEVAVELAQMTRFQRRVLDACRRIPYGETISYAGLARAVGQPLAARAVGSVMAANPLPLVIPCHRVLRSDGSLGGFSSPDGVKLKQRMLDLESQAVAARSEIKLPRGTARTRRRVELAAVC